MFEILAAKGLHYLLNIVHEWKEKYHVDEKDNIVFQNKFLLANVRFSNNSMHTIQTHSAGFENIPTTIEDPDECWMTWGDAKQKIVLRNYIKFGEQEGYVVQTRDGVISDAFSVGARGMNKYRKGIYYSK